VFSVNNGISWAHITIFLENWKRLFIL
jgi:hypothetical protein